MEVYLAHKDRISLRLGCPWALTMNKQLFSHVRMERVERSAPPLRQDVHVHVAGSRTGVAGFVWMDGRARFKEGCRNWALWEVQKLITLTHLCREIRIMQRRSLVSFRGIALLAWR